MRKVSLNPRALLACALVCAVYPVAKSTYAQPPVGPTAAPGNPATAGTDVLTRGPIHEAYAEPVSSGDGHPVVIQKRPPDAIDEIPPDMKPADPSAIWISGYWAWDDDRRDFVWVSGVWRVPPPGQRWIAGYWTEVPGGFSWVAGFWSPADVEEITYYPPPPTTEEQGPTSAQPTPDSVWITGHWQWGNDRYAWQPGYWTAVDPGWIWTPASFAWCPRGWIYRAGFWDYPLDQRGVLFAPAYFSNAAYRHPNFFYSPSVVVNSDLLTFYLFVRPNYSHYYFGDYFAADYDAVGIYPWFALRRQAGYSFDPLLTYYNWSHSRSDPHWVENLKGWHDYYRTHPDHRPPHDLAAQQRMIAAAGDRPDRNFLSVTESLQNFSRGSNPRVPLAAVTAAEKARVLQTARLVRQSGAQRSKIETEGKVVAGQGSPASGVPAAPRAPERLRLPKVAGTFIEAAPATPLLGAGPSRGPGDGRRETLKPVVPATPPGKSGGAPPVPSPSVPPGSAGHRQSVPGEMRKPVLPPPSPGKANPPPRLPQVEPRNQSESVRPEGSHPSPQPLPQPKAGRPEPQRPRAPEPAPSRTEGKDAPHKNHDERK